MTATVGRPLDHFCGTCRYALDRYIVAGEPDRFEHVPAATAWDGPAHEPVPVPLAEFTHVRMVCDVCTEPDPTWAYRFVTSQSPISGGVYDLGEWWVVCTPCADVIEDRAVDGMLLRAMRPFTGHSVSRHQLAKTLAPIYIRILGSPFERRPVREVRW